MRSLLLLVLALGLAGCSITPINLPGVDGGTTMKDSGLPTDSASKAYDSALADQGHNAVDSWLGSDAVPDAERSDGGVDQTTPIDGGGEKQPADAGAETTGSDGKTEEHSPDQTQSR